MKNDSIGERRTRRAFWRLVCVAAIAATFAAILPRGVYAQALAPPTVPDTLQVLAPNQVVFVGHGIGTQNYVCLPSPSSGQVAWTLFTPEATLLSDSGEQLTTHFFSPNPAEGGIVRVTWEHSGDTSTVWGRVVASSTDPNFVSANAIPWPWSKSSAPRQGQPAGTRYLGPPSFRE